MGDIITNVNGLIVRDVRELIAEVNRHYIGEAVTLTVWRNGSFTTETVTLLEG